MIKADVGDHGCRLDVKGRPLDIMSDMVVLYVDFLKGLLGNTPEVVRPSIAHAFMQTMAQASQVTLDELHITLPPIGQKEATND